jgi:hypothetical protein
MAPKGKKGKKAQDTSWEDDMDAIAAETTGASQDAPAAESPAAEAPVENSKAPLEVDPEEEFGGGGLLGALRKQKKKKGGKQQAEEEKPVTPEAVASPAAEEDDDDKEELNASGRVMTKKEKEKAKKEREKQRKKEQVRLFFGSFFGNWSVGLTCNRLLERRVLQLLPRPRLLRSRRKLSSTRQLPLQLRRTRRARRVRAKCRRLPFSLSRSNKRPFENARRKSNG